jgi:hypothetical protein
MIHRNCFDVIFADFHRTKNIHLKKQISFPFLILLLLVFAATWSCRKDVNVSDDPSITLDFSNDSIIFDTVFTTIGSTTQTLMVYNNSDKRVKISNIMLAGGNQSAYRINVDGQAGSSFSDIEINAKDSLYIFTRVTIDPNNINSPFVVEDSLFFLTNGNEQKVKLIAWGQNANYILADTYTPGFPPYKVVADSLETVRWTSERPYVIYGYAVIDSYGELIIEEGTQVLFHENSGLWAYVDGVLKVNGTPENQVYFGGDRLEDFYSDIPGQWDRIWLMEGRAGFDHEIRNAVIENGFIGVQAESFLRATENRLIMHNVTIRNMQGIGLFSRIFYIEGTNMVVANSGGYCMALTGGGVYDFKHTTVANYWSYSVRTTPAVILTNYLTDTSNQPIPISMDFAFGNGLIYGYNIDEFETDMVGGADSIYRVSNSIMRTSLDISNTDIYNQILKNEDPLFLDTRENDYRIDTLSPAIDRGDPAIASFVPLDILGNSRAERADAGAYQFMPGQSSGDN